ncbi:hypothetical protein BV898_17019 [Hypsibius exemplaris]|uniref:Receptor ligand binding region domain-containing protein n=1 Tax=Hypsibius exemplaris TaxID=2072580 RepID=A0A9X6NGZ1_HYPEX|nr:hypothetical protein BV898_17019 [Hypsibius exemplaris]
MTDGSYVYVLTTALTQPFEGSRLRNMSDEHRFQEARRSYPSCLLLDYGSNEKFEFSEAINGLHPLIDAWKAQSKREYNVTYPVSRQTVHAPAAYESVVVVAQMADQLRLRDPFDFNDGALLARQFFGKTFETKIGNITFDQLGQSVAEIAIGYYDLVEDNFVPFLKYERISDASEIRAIRKPRWEGGGWPVPSEPLCGFQGQRCAFGSSNTDAVVGGGLCLLALVILIIAFRVIWRRWATIRSEFWVLDDTYLLLPKTQHSNVS